MSTNLVKANWGNIFTIACERNYCLPLHQKKNFKQAIRSILIFLQCSLVIIKLIDDK
jgi:hypothetical protein